MEANDHFNFTGLPPAPAASGLKPSPSGEGLYTNGSPMNFPQQGKSKCEGHGKAWEGVGLIPFQSRLMGGDLVPSWPIYSTTTLSYQVGGSN